MIHAGRKFVARWLMALEVAAYRWLWLSHCLYIVSLVMHRLALGWLTLNLTNSAWWVGAAAGMDGVGKIMFGFVAGVIVDRWDKGRVLLLAHLLFGALTMALGGLILTGAAALWSVLLIAFVLGGLDALLAPANNAMVFQLVGRERMMNAAVVNMLGFNGARVIAGALMGGVIDRWGMGACYVLIGAFAWAGIVPLLSVRGMFRSSAAREPFWTALQDGVRYAWRDVTLRQVLGLSVIVELCGFSHYTMIPVIARDVLRVGATGLGYLTAAGGVGAALGTVALASLGDVRRKGALLWALTMSAGGGLILFALSPWYALSLALSALLGGWLAAYDALMQALVQLLAPDGVRGRVLSLYVLTFGFTSVGGYLAGLIATAVSAPFAIGVGGSVLVLYLLGVMRTLRQLRPMAVVVAD